MIPCVASSARCKDSAAIPAVWFEDEDEDDEDDSRSSNTAVFGGSGDQARRSPMEINHNRFFFFTVKKKKIYLRNSPTVRIDSTTTMTPRWIHGESTPLIWNEIWSCSAIGRLGWIELLRVCDMRERDRVVCWLEREREREWEICCVIINVFVLAFFCRERREEEERA